jgi:hypothetical protein
VALVGVENYNINDFNKLPGWENNKAGYGGVIYIGPFWPMFLVPYF